MLPFKDRALPTVHVFDVSAVVSHASLCPLARLSHQPADALAVVGFICTRSMGNI
jgi:hypothetical protein